MEKGVLKAFVVPTCAEIEVPGNQITPGLLQI